MPSLASRAATALALTVGFYLLAIVIAAALLTIPYLELVYANEIYIRPTLFCIVGGVAILWSILPRFDRFAAPGPRLEESAQPELFAMLRDTANKTEQAMPREVYVINQVNAWVAQRGGFAGIGSRRVMGVGLPLMQSLTRSQFQAVIAHEFGHYHGGDTALGPWIYKTREAIGRTVRNLAASGGGSLHKPFLWYGNFFLRITQSISREQELAADRLAAGIAGAKNAANALIAVEGASAAFDAYWRSEFIPVLTNGYHAPLAAGFTQFMKAGSISEAVKKTVESALTSASADPFDSHPPLRERVAALEELPPGTVVDDEPHASTLLRDVPSVERALLRTLLIDPTVADRLKDVAWNETGSTIYLPSWREQRTKNETALRGLTVGDIPRVLLSMKDFERAIVVDKLTQDRSATAKYVLSCALATALHDAGWNCENSPGNQIAFTRDGRSIEPFAVVARLGERDMTAETWASDCRDAGIDALPLG